MNHKISPHFNLSLLIHLSLLISLSLFSSNGIRAQSIAELLMIAEQNNHELKALEKEYLAVLEKAPQVNQLPDPEVSLGLFVLPTETRLGPQRIAFGAMQMFPWKGTLDAREAVVLSMAKATYERIAATKLDLVYQVKTAYFQLYELEESMKIIKGNIEIFNALESLTLSKTENGKGSLADVLRVQLKIAELEQQLKIINNQKRGALAQLNQVLARPVDTPVQVTEIFSLAVMTFDKDLLRKNIWENHPGLRMFARQQETAQKEINLNTLNGKPTFGVGMDYIMVGKRNDMSPEGNGRDILIPKVKVSIPIYRKKYTAKAQEEQLKMAALENRKEDVLLKFLARIEKAYADHEDAVLKLELYQKQITTTKAVIYILQESYSNSGSSFDELLRLENDLINYDMSILKAVVNSQKAKIEVERYLVNY